MTASDSSVCVLQFYWHVIVLSIGQMKCSLCHKSLKPNCCIFDKAVFFFLTAEFFVLVTARSQRMRLTTIFMSEIPISKPVHLKVAEQFTSIKENVFYQVLETLCFLRVQCLWNDTKSS